MRQSHPTPVEPTRRGWRPQAVSPLAQPVEKRGPGLVSSAYPELPEGCLWGDCPELGGQPQPPSLFCFEEV